jgi:CheY-like chemotaxis protein
MKTLTDDKKTEEQDIIARTLRLEVLVKLSAVPVHSIRPQRIALDALSALDARASFVQRVGEGGAPETLAAHVPDHDADGDDLQAYADHFAAEVVSGRRAIRAPNLAGVILERDGPTGRRAAGSYLGAPMFDPSGDAVGVVAVFGNEPDEFDEEDEWWLKAAAHLCSVTAVYEAVEARLNLLEKALAKPAEATGGAPAGAAPVAAAGVGPEEAGAAPATPARKGLILLVDDDRAVNATIRKNLLRYGYQVDSAADGLEALRIFHEGEHDVVISDIQMPHMNGWELVTSLKSRRPDLPAILITGYSNIGGVWNQAFLKQHGVVAVVNKPLDFDYLNVLIEDQLSARRRVA